jgi:hypothetical protein
VPDVGSIDAVFPGWLAEPHADTMFRPRVHVNKCCLSFLSAAPGAYGQRVTLAAQRVRARSAPAAPPRERSRFWANWSRSDAVARPVGGHPTRPARGRAGAAIAS